MWDGEGHIHILCVAQESPLLEISLIALADTLVEGVEHTLEGPSFDEVPVTHHFVGDIPRRNFFYMMVLSRQPTYSCSYHLALCAISLPPRLAMWSLTHLS